jgi:phosphatidylserine/phosphatidylglycerophosphate/cardiolipin synthase-like enzyme
MGSRLLRVLLLTCALAGCVGLPRHVIKYQSVALRTPQDTALGRLVSQAEDDDPKSYSGVRLLSSGESAFDSLLALADHAERTLDVQYYIIRQDDSARAFLAHLRAAADRGVRVRVLVDDLNTTGEDRRFMHLEQHRNIDVRLFNPFPGGRSATWSRILNSLYDIPRINHRMHNKLMVADNALAITGGRNIGDEYFTRDRYSNFIDLDVVVAGPVVPQLSASFDAFWNSKYAYPISSLVPQPGAADGSGTGAPAALEPAPDAEANWLARELDAHMLDLQWVPATVLADRPAKIASESGPEEVTIANNVDSLLSQARSDIIIISPYFVPGPQGMELLKELRARGVRVRALTNSLASTDASIVHEGYARYRRALLALGVELFEVRPRLGHLKPRFHSFRSANASLHAKAIVIDGKTVFIGSLNMDGRSARFNSELGLVLRSSDIAQQVTSLFDDIIADGSYRLTLDAHSHILWSSGPPGAQRIWHRDPESGAVHRFLLKLLAPFAPEEML